MGRKKSDAEIKSHQQHLLMAPSEIEAIDNWMFENRIRSRGEAIRRLCQTGIVLERELRPTIRMVIDHIRDTLNKAKPQLTRQEYDAMHKDMAIALLNAGTVLQKLDAESTDDAIRDLTDLYAYYREREAQEQSTRLSRNRAEVAGADEPVSSSQSAPAPSSPPTPKLRSSATPPRKRKPKTST